MRNDHNERFELEKTRLLAYWMLAPNVKKGKSFKPTDLVKFAWELPKEKKPITRDSDEYQELIKAFKEIPLPKK
jgi:hypothetical protein